MKRCQSNFRALSQDTPFPSGTPPHDPLVALLSLKISGTNLVKWTCMFTRAARSKIALITSLAIAICTWGAYAGRARAADPSIENSAYERFINGDIDAFDWIDTRPRSKYVPPARPGPSAWFSLLGFANQTDTQINHGLIGVLTLAFDKIAAGPPSVERPPKPELGLTSKFARRTVLAAWKAAGLGVDDARLDAIVSRARVAALLPEARFRATHLRNERASTQSVPEESQYYDSAGANLGLEARLTWRLDRLLYADDEPAFERMRLDRAEARMRIAKSTLEALFVWQRARIDLGRSEAGSRDETEIWLRIAEAEATLDTLTNGWFSAEASSRRAP